MSEALPYSKKEFEAITSKSAVALRLDRVRATIEQGYADNTMADDNILYKFAEDVVKLRGNPELLDDFDPLENLTHALMVAREYDVTINIHIPSQGGMFIVTGARSWETEFQEVEPQEIYSGTLEEVPVAIVNWLFYTFS